MPRRSYTTMPDGLDGESLFVLSEGILLFGVSLTIHSFFMLLILKSQAWLKRGGPGRASDVFFLVPSILLATVFIALSSLVELTTWAQVLWHMGPFDSFLDAMYFSSTTDTALGTAKHVLVPPYRALEPMEAATGMLASGLNTAILFAILASMGRSWPGFEDFFR
jgi:hypothetical protein